MKHLCVIAAALLLGGCGNTFEPKYAAYDRTAADTLKGDRFTLKTKAGETLVLGAEGAGYPTGI